jgi:tetratricopeptide (TPR) repeat protein
MSSSVLIHTPNSAQPQRESGAARVSSRASATEELHVPGRPPLEAPPASARSTLPVSAGPVRAREMIKVLPTAREVRLNPELVQAHSALQAGDFGSSRNLYARVMLSDPLNTDALLGMAYIATHDNRIEDAAKLYLRILQAHPRHAAAQAALISMMSKADPLSAETQLRQLISREPSAFLHFVLGNVYADQSLWSQAQLAYFQAHHLEPDNADYAYNLAIGLDHLHQSKVALNFYRRAEQLAATHGRAHFNLSRLRERISALAMYVE